LRAIANGVAAQAAQRSAASLLRNQATVAGTLISEPSGILAVALAALDAQLVWRPETILHVGKRDWGSALTQLIRDGALVTAIVIPASAIGKRASLQTVARTPRDQPIVCVGASARMEILRPAQNDKIARGVCIALGGVAEIAVRVESGELELEGRVWSEELIESVARKAAQGLSPRGDYRGSGAYRQEMAAVLTRRALKEL
jgi:carbon-monoxide dehydrogenase medium subunit